MVRTRPLQNEAPVDYGEIKIGTKKLEDAILDLGSIPKVKRHYRNKEFIMKAIADRNFPLMREISNYFYQTNGIYSRVIDYFAFLYRYDWYVVPEIKNENVKTEKVLDDFLKLLNFLDNSHIKRVCGEIALEVLKNGAYYGYIVPSSNGLILQELPIKYCRSRFNCGAKPAVEFNMRFFDDNFGDIEQRMRILKMFPKDFQKGYSLYKQGKLPADNFFGDQMGWYLLDPQSAVKFSFSNGDQPLFINAIPALLDLDAAQDLDRRKQMQDLLKIVIQKLPIDKNGDLIFDVEEATDIHNNAVEMLSHAIGVDVLTTFADIAVEDMADGNTNTSSDDLERVERTVYNYFGTSRNLFNTDGNLSLEKSILDDESTVRTLLLQMGAFFNDVAYQLSTSRGKYVFKLYMLETTQYNYKDMSKLYKEQVQLGYSKMLPQIALGHSQSSILNAAHFENEVLHLSEVMIPPLMSSTMNAEGLAALRTENIEPEKAGTLATSAIAAAKAQQANAEAALEDRKNQVEAQKQTNAAKAQPVANKTAGQSNSAQAAKSQASSSSNGSAGRPSKPDDQKSAKTIANRESMS